MNSIQVLAVLARRLNREAGSPALPSLYFFTDPARTPDPAGVAKRLPRGAAIVYRHYGHANRARLARALARVAMARGLTLLIAADPELARSVGAHGVHWPERLLPSAREKFGLTTAAAHSVQALARAGAFGVDACFLAPVFSTRSSGGHSPLGPFHASQLARGATMPVVALGGVNARTGARLIGRGFAGLAAVEAFAV